MSEKNTSENKLSRRIFLMGSAATVAGYAATAGSRPKVRAASANDKLNIAAIGCGGKGMSDMWALRSENIVALCDVNERQAEEARDKFPKAKFYRDFRKMLENEPSIDACTVSTPDHTHAVAAAMAMRMGKHVYVQKPLTHNLYEARLLQEIANETGVATQMGNQGHSQEGVRYLCEAIWDGAIGPIREVHIWTNRPIWPQGLNRPDKTDPVPDHLDWDLWLGPAQHRPFVDKHPETGKDCYQPFAWRGWWDFGTGALGDMACHIMDPANWALHLDNPVSVEPVKIVDDTKEMGPTSSITKYEFGPRGDMPACTIYWYEGGLFPHRPADIPEDEPLGDEDGKNGTLFIGDKGYMTCGTYGGNPRIVPKSQYDEYTPPDPYLERVPGNSPYEDWLRAAKGGPEACSNFNYSVPLTEIVLLGVLAQRARTRIQWDSKYMRVINNPEAQKFVKRDYRKGWEL